MSSRQAEVESVIEAERDWVQAHRDLDLKTLERLMADDYIKIGADGSVIGKAEVLDDYQYSERHWAYAESDQYQIRILGDVAVLVGRWKARGENNGEAFDYTARFMSVYMKQDGVWQIVAEQSTLITEN
jgi:ketosteroid isomerase-like protein